MNGLYRKSEKGAIEQVHVSLSRALTTLTCYSEKADSLFGNSLPVPLANATETTESTTLSTYSMQTHKKPSVD